MNNFKEKKKVQQTKFQMASSALINTFAAEFTKFGNFMFDHVRKTMAADPDADMPEVEEMVRLYLQPDEPVKLKKPRAKKAVSKIEGVEVTQVPVAVKATGPGKAGKNKELCTATTGKGTQCTRCAAQGQVFCNVHLKASAASSEKGSEKKTKTIKKKHEDLPKHTHPIEEKAEEGSCDLCETHGNPTDEDDSESQFEVRSSFNPMVLGEEEFFEDE